MKIAWIQYKIEWLKPQRNFEKLEKLLNSITDDFDILVLPEMFDTGFYMNPQTLKDRDYNVTLEWMKTQSEKFDCTIIGSLIVKKNNKSYNRLYCIDKKSTAHYDKIHLFSLSGENNRYSAGDKAIIYETKDGLKLSPFICYDLRFPSISTHKGEVDLLVYVANWPESRAYHWTTLLKARAIENQCFVLGVNRIGRDENDLSYNGDSMLVDFNGQVLEHSENAEGIFIQDINLEDMKICRHKLPFLKDRK